METYVVIKDITKNNRVHVTRTLNFIKSKIAKENVNDIPSFTTWFSTLVSVVKQYNLYEIIDMTEEELEQKRLDIIEFEGNFALNFMQKHTRKKITKLRKQFRSGVIRVNGEDMFFGQRRVIDEISQLLTDFKQYTDKVVELYYPIVEALSKYLSKEELDVNDFMEHTKFIGRVQFHHTIGGIDISEYAFVNELEDCLYAEETMMQWVEQDYNFPMYDTNVPVGNVQEDE